MIITIFIVIIINVISVICVIVIGEEPEKLGGATQPFWGLSWNYSELTDQTVVP